MCARDSKEFKSDNNYNDLTRNDNNDYNYIYNYNDLKRTTTTTHELTNLLLEDSDDRHGGVHVGVEALLQRLLVVVAAARSGSTSGQTPKTSKTEIKLTFYFISISHHKGGNLKFELFGRESIVLTKRL